MRLSLPRVPSLPRLAGAAALAAAALAVTGASPAQAALISTGACDDAVLTKPFSAWGDNANYKLIPGGDFEGKLRGWSRSSSAVIVDDARAVGNNALSLPAGASVQTPSTCVNTSYPTFRIFAKSTEGAATVLAEVVYRVPLLGSVTVPVGVVTLNGGWSPSLPMVTGSTVMGVLSDGTAQAALRFTALTGTTQIDDIYVDPRMR